jgi:hypothetical protein
VHTYLPAAALLPEFMQRVWVEVIDRRLKVHTYMSGSYVPFNIVFDNHSQ